MVMGETKKKLNIFRYDVWILIKYKQTEKPNVFKDVGVFI